MGIQDLARGLNLRLKAKMRAIRLAPLGFNPATLFAAGEQGILNDLSDLSTLFTDTAGTTPVTAPGQTVALALDKSRGLVLGPELVINGDFSAGATGWELGGDWVIANNRAEKLTQTINSNLSFNANALAGTSYVFEFDVIINTGANSVFIDTTATNTVVIGTGRQRIIVVSPRTGVTRFSFRSLAASTFVIDNISVRELPGNHLTQSVAAARPIYGRHPAGGIRNRLAATENLSILPWTVLASGVANPIRTASSGNAPDGTNTATKIDFPAVSSTQFSVVNQAQTSLPVQSMCGSIWLKAATGADVGRTVFVYGRDQSGKVAVVLTSDWQRVTTDAMAAVANPQLILATLGTSFAGGLDQPAFSFLAWGAQLEVGSTATAYQRVGAPSGLAFPRPQSYDITEAGVPSLHYLFCDGLARWMVSPTITPGVDKAQVIAGVRKLSDAAFQAIAETSTTADSNQGSLAVGVSAATFDPTRQNWSTILAGTTAGLVTSALGIPAPDTKTLSLLLDLSQATHAQEAILRLNGAVATVTRSPQTAGAGNFNAYPLYIGSRAGASAFFNGLIYSLVVRFGPNLPLATIQQVERWTAQKAGVTLP